MSTNCTMDDNPGTGRTIDKHIYQPGGRFIERIIFRFVKYLRNPELVNTPGSDRRDTIASDGPAARTPDSSPGRAVEEDIVENLEPNPEAPGQTETMPETVLRLWGKLTPLSDFSGVRSQSCSMSLLFSSTMDEKNSVVVAHLLDGLVSQICIPDDGLKLMALINVFFLGSEDMYMFVYLKKSMSASFVLDILLDSATKRARGNIRHKYLKAISKLALEVIREGEEERSALNWNDISELKANLLHAIRKFRSKQTSQPCLAVISILTLLTRGLKRLFLTSFYHTTQMFDVFMEYLCVLYHLVCTLCFLLPSLDESASPQKNNIVLTMKQASRNYSDSLAAAFINILHQWPGKNVAREEFANGSIHIFALFYTLRVSLLLPNAAMDAHAIISESLFVSVPDPQAPGKGVNPIYKMWEDGITKAWETMKSLEQIEKGLKATRGSFFRARISKESDVAKGIRGDLENEKKQEHDGPDCAKRQPKDNDGARRPQERNATSLGDQSSSWLQSETTLSGGSESLSRSSSQSSHAGWIADSSTLPSDHEDFEASFLYHRPGSHADKLD